MKRSHSNFIDHLEGKHEDRARGNCSICAYLRERYGIAPECPNCGGPKEHSARQCRDCERFEASKRES